MADIIKFPNGGYDVTIIRKQDVLDCIDANIIDKEVALDLIAKLEIDAMSVVNSGMKANIPFLGSIQMKTTRKIYDSADVKESIIDARNTLDKDSYIMFRKKLSKTVAEQASYDKFYQWRANAIVKANPKKFRELAAAKGEHFAKFYLFSLDKMCAVDNEVIYLEYGN